MKSKRSIFIAFILNLGFSVFELVGGFLTGSVAIASDALHDLGDALGIGISWFLEKKSHKKPDEIYTYGYGRFSVLGGLLTAGILVLGAVFMIGNGIFRLFHPTQISYNGMIAFAVVGVVVNICAALVTHGGSSLNQRAVNLHMLEDVLGWVVVLIGAVVMRFTKLWALDPLLSIGVSVFILIHAVKHLQEGSVAFLEKAPVDYNEIREAVCAVEGVEQVHHIHLWSIDGQTHCATMHIVTQSSHIQLKEQLRQCLHRLGVDHVTLELEGGNEPCGHRCCDIGPAHHHHCHGGISGH